MLNKLETGRELKEKNFFASHFYLSTLLCMRPAKLAELMRRINYFLFSGSQLLEYLKSAWEDFKRSSSQKKKKPRKNLMRPMAWKNSVSCLEFPKKGKKNATQTTPVFFFNYLFVARLLFPYFPFFRPF